MSMIHDITAAVPRFKKSRRKGRGEGSGRGKTCGRGTKGAKARVGGPYWKPGHEGGQTPIHRRLPTRGFSNAAFARNWYVVNLADLNEFEDGTTVDAAALIKAGLIPDAKLPVKVLGDGELSKKLSIQAGWYSKSAHAKIAAAGGTTLNAAGEPFAYPKPKFVPRPKAAQAKEGAPEGGEPKAPKKEKAKKQAPPAESSAPAEPPPQA